MNEPNTYTRPCSPEAIGVERIYSNYDATMEQVLLAIVVHAWHRGPGTTFFTDPEEQLQLGQINRRTGAGIDAHFHCAKERKVTHTQEVLFVRSGQVKVNFYDYEARFIASRVLGAGDVVMLLAGGHGFHALDELDMIEVKQGPYLADQDKVYLNVKHGCTAGG
jgi:mannose-6-phosphate isomerase-like protein (cupin superfamily)